MVVKNGGGIPMAETNIGMKTCRCCKQSAPLADFYMARRNRDGRYSYCRTCARQQTARWERDNPAKKRATTREYWLKTHYGITQKQYDAMLVSQGGRCKICRSEGRNTRRAQRFALHVDHDHKSGHVRGLLCHRCNTILGNAGDDVDILLQAIQYLQTAKAEEESDE